MALGDLIGQVARGADSHTPWPPHELKEHWSEVRRYRRRYRNKRSEMIQDNPNIAANNARIESYVPVPWPRELCRFSAALLFSESPRVALQGDTEAQGLDDLMRVNDFGAFAIRGGVRAAAEGRIAVRVIRDADISPTPLLTLVNEDQVIWDIRHGHFYVGGTVVIERKMKDPDRRGDDPTFRLLEDHRKGIVTRELYKGYDNELGKRVPLNTLREFEGLADDEETGLDAPTLVPWENVPGSESDMFGLGPVFDDLNEQESLLLDRVRKSIPRVFVDRSLTDETGRLAIDGYIITGGSRMRMPLGTTATSTIEVAQPQLLAQEAITGIDHVQQLMVTCAGYSPLTWGIQGQTASVTRAVSGYAMKLAQLRTLLTRSAKEHMALQALGLGTATALAWANASKEVASFLPDIQLGDGLPNDPLDGAQEVLFLRQAAAASTETLVRTVHPTWSEKQIDDEVNAILDGVGMPPGAGPALGLGNLPKHVRALLDRADEDDPRAGAGVDPAPSLQ